MLAGGRSFASSVREPGAATPLTTNTVTSAATIEALASNMPLDIRYSVAWVNHCS
jgi:hypothetical protein